MQAVILTAGFGSRMQELTKENPKGLLHYQGKSLLHHKIDILPKEIDEVVFVIGYLGYKIKNTFGSHYQNKKMVYIEDNEIKGTAHSLFKAKDILKNRFLVLMGDDIYGQEAIQNAMEHDWSMTIKKVSREEKVSRVILEKIDQDHRLQDFMEHSKYVQNFEDEGFAFTGLYSMTEEVFNFEKVKIEDKEEYGLPQTILKNIDRIKLKILETNFWKQLNTKEDLQN